MRWLITGSGGRLGVALIARLSADDTGLTGAEDDVVLPLDRATLDVTDSSAVREAMSVFRPDVVLNAAAFDAPATAAVPDADADADADADEHAAYAVNPVGPAVLAAAVAATGGRLVHVSCDLVFPGDTTAPYPVDAPTAPRSAYGRTKLAGELAVRELSPDQGYVVRTSWLYGTPDEASTPAPTETGQDRRGAPTWIPDLAEGLIALARSDAPAGIYHCTNAGATTPSAFARAALDELDELAPQAAQAAGDAPRSTTGRVPRSAYSVLSGQEWAAAGLSPLPDWRDALHRCFLMARDRRGPS